jgi:MATE family multidrug resistance protein
MPIGLTSVFETSMFQASAVMMGWIGTVELAAHGIALELASLAFMIHMGVSNAATIRAGRARGAGDLRGLRDGAIAALVLSFSVGLLTVVAFLAMPKILIGLFLDRSAAEAAQILAFGTLLLAVGGLFQLFDAGQVMALGLLRGVQDTRVPMIVAGCSYWLVGIPVSYLLAFGLGFGGVGLWAGLAAGLACSASILTLRFWRGPWLRA